MAADAEKKNIIIIGGGIIGCTTAYFLTRHPSFNPALHCVTLIEATKIAGGASGKAGGLLALWAYPSNIVPLSYRLHAELAKEHNGAEEWGYRRIHCGQLSAKGRPMASNVRQSSKDNGESISLQKRSKETIGTLRAAGIPKDLDWFAADSVQDYDEMGDPNTTAQVHPYQFTTAMARLAAEKGAEIKLGSVTNIGIPSEGGDVVKSVTYIDKETSESHTVPATHVILSAGPWTRTVYPPAPISAMRAHSVTVRPSKPVSAYAIFSQISLPSNFHGDSAKSSKRGRGSAMVSPELYARPNNEVYACGEGDTLIPLPKSSDLVQTDLRRCDEIFEHISSVSDEMRDGEVTARQACYLPNVTGAASGPLIGETGVKGLLLAAGHTCWGIQNGPGTGKLMSEFVFDGNAKSADVRSLDPRRVL